MTALYQGAHGSTFGGSPLACAAGLAALQAYRDEGLIERSATLGAPCWRRCARGLDGVAVVRDIRGLGLMLAIELRTKVAPVLKSLMLEHRVIALPAGPTVLRLLPPLVMTDDEADHGVRAVVAGHSRSGRVMDRAAAIALVHGLVAIPSVSRQESEAAAWLVSQMQAAGYERAEVDGAGNAVGELGAADARAHDRTCSVTSTPSPATSLSASSPPPSGDVLYGRGSVDAKGPLATFVAAGARVGARGRATTTSASSSSAPSRRKPRPARARVSSPRGSTASSTRSQLRV